MAQIEGFLQQRTGIVLSLLPAERLMVGLILTVWFAAVDMALLMERDVNWPPFVVGICATMAMVAIGAYVRGVKHGHRLALGTTGVGLFMGFTAATSIFIFTLFPLSHPLVDNTLVRLDHMMGYDWPAFITMLSHHPILAAVLGPVYNSSLPQMVTLTVVLAALSRETDLHHFLLVGMVSLLVTVGLWWVWPSVGYSGFATIPKDVMLAAGLTFEVDYNTYLRSLLEVGPARITPEVVTGVVGFPSYHTIMACLVVWYSRRTFLFIPAVIINVLMLPAILSHGGHHVLDMLGGIVVFAACAWGVARVIPEKA